MTDFVVVFSPRARQKLRTIERYLANRFSPPRAAEYVARIVARCNDIALAPLQGERLDDLRPGLRKTGMEGRVAILFTVEGSVVTILSVAYGGRQFQTDFRR